jgi:hypothetical protein
MADLEIKDLKSAYYYTSLSYKDFKHLIKKRGKLWDSMKLMKKRIAKLSDETFIDIFNKFVTEDKKNYYNKIFRL